MNNPCQSGSSIAKTDLTSTGCYAAALQDCDGRPPSSEHFVSRGLLGIIGDTVKVTGLPWSREAKVLPVAAIRANVLCQKHNQALSPLDAEAARFFGLCLGLRAGTLQGSHKFKGADIERWMIKTLCGLLASGNAYVNGNAIKAPPPVELLNILFSIAPLDDRWALHMLLDEPAPENIHDLQIAVETGQRNSKIAGITVAFKGLVFHAGRAHEINQDGRPFEYRPAHLIYVKAAVTVAVIDLDWDSPDANTTVVLSSTLWS